MNQLLLVDSNINGFREFFPFWEASCNDVLMAGHGLMLGIDRGEPWN